MTFSVHRFQTSINTDKRARGVWAGEDRKRYLRRTRHLIPQWPLLKASHREQSPGTPIVQTVTEFIQ